MWNIFPLWRWCFSLIFYFILLFVFNPGFLDFNLVSAELSGLQKLAIGYIQILWASKASYLCQWISAWAGECIQCSSSFQVFSGLLLSSYPSHFSSGPGCSLSVRQGYVQSLGPQKSFLLLPTAFQSARVVWGAYQAPLWLSHLQAVPAALLDSLTVFFFFFVTTKTSISDSSHWPSLFVYCLDHCIYWQFHWALELPPQIKWAPSRSSKTDPFWPALV